MTKREGIHTLIVGLTRSGKTYFTKKMLRAYERIIVVDPDDEYSSLPGFHRIDGERGDAALNELLELLYDNWDSTFKVAFVPDESCLIEQVHEISKLPMWMGDAFMDGRISDNTAFVVDETADSMPLSMPRAFSGAERVARRGAKRGIDMIGITQSPADTSYKFRKQCKRIVSFQLTDDASQEAIEKPIRLWGAKSGEVKQRIGTLKQYHHFAWEAGKDYKVMGPVS